MNYGGSNVKYLLNAITCPVSSFRLSHELSHLILVLIQEVNSIISSHFSGWEMRPKEVKFAQGHIAS